MQQLDNLDWISISFYFLLLAGIAVWVIRKKEDNTEDYFLAGRNVGWFVVGASIFGLNTLLVWRVPVRVINCLCLFMKYMRG